MEGLCALAERKYKLAEILNPKFGVAFKRISNALRAHSLTFVEWVRPEEAEATIIHVVGGEEYDSAMKLKNAVVIQHCVSMPVLGIPEWEKLWTRALLTVSFHDLHSYSDKEFNHFFYIFVESYIIIVSRTFRKKNYCILAIKQIIEFS